jgi:hypothetical protein
MKEVGNVTCSRIAHLFTILCFKFLVGREGSWSECDRDASLLGDHPVQSWIGGEGQLLADLLERF